MSSLFIYLFIGFIAFMILGCAFGKGGVVLIVTGVLMTAVSGFIYAGMSAEISSADFWWDYYGTSTYSEAVMMKNILLILVFVGIALIIIGAIATAGKSKNKNNNAWIPQQEMNVRTNICPVCGCRMNAGYSFCPKCGTKTNPS